MSELLVRRCISRAEITDSGALRGYAAVYDVPTDKQAQFNGTETIARGAFDAALAAQDDVLFTIDHDPTLLLGRTSSGTLRLFSDEHGLGYELDLPNTQRGQDTREMVKRGDLRGASFTAAMDRSTIERTASGVVHRNFTRLVDVCVTAMPAYVETDVAARSEGHGRSLRAQLASIRAHVLTKGSRP